MANIVRNGGKIHFSPDTGWNWDGWDGQMEITSNEHVLKSESQAVVLPEDIKNLENRLIGCSYKAEGFTDTPGSVVSAQIRVDEATLSATISVGGTAVATALTTGTFKVSCAPSVKAGSPPVPDPMAASRTGRWEVVDTGQERLRDGAQ